MYTINFSSTNCKLITVKFSCTCADHMTCTATVTLRDIQHYWIEQLSRNGTDRFTTYSVHQCSHCPSPPSSTCEFNISVVYSNSRSAKIHYQLPALSSSAAHSSIHSLLQQLSLKWEETWDCNSMLICSIKCLSIVHISSTPLSSYILDALNSSHSSWKLCHTHPVLVSVWFISIGIRARDDHISVKQAQDGWILDSG